MSKSKLLNNYLEVLCEDNIQEIGFLAALGATSSAVMILRYGSELAKDYLTKAGRECVSLKGASKNACIVSYKIRALDKQIQALQTGMSNCPKLRNPEKCRLTISNKLKDLNRRKSDFQRHYAMFRSKENQEKRNDQIK